MEAVVGLLGLVFFLFIFVILPILAAGIRIVNQYERGLIFTLGKYSSLRSPGLNIIIPVIQSMRKIDMRSTPVDVPRQEVITKDNVTVGVDAVVYFRVMDPAKAVLETTDYRYATAHFAQASLRDMVGNVELDELLSNREEISAQIKEIADAQTDQWGIDVESVKIQNIELPQDMKRAMAKQAEAERERRAVIINAEGEKEAAQKVAEAAEMLSKAAGGVTIRTLQTLEKISSEPSQKTVFVLPSDIAGAVSKLVK